MKSFISIIASYFLILLASAVWAQQTPSNKVVITGVRFAYPLVEKWIKDYKEVSPQTEIVIESRTTTDPAKYDLLIEAYEPEPSVKETREYLYLARYALLPIANSNSAFAKAYGEKGLTNELIKQIYFHDILADKSEAKSIQAPFTIYTRLQKAGAPTTFAQYFGYTQQNIKGKAIAGADEHLIKALQKDSTAISYSTPSLLYDLKTRHLISGVKIIPVDLDGNNKVNDSERIYSDLDAALLVLEQDDIKNVPIGDLHISISKINERPEALKFLLWIIQNSQDDLHSFGYLKPDQKRFEHEKEKFDQRALK
jgi:ABC-type phosphate transport system substrate-binding protein